MLNSFLNVESQRIMKAQNQIPCMRKINPQTHQLNQYKEEKKWNRKLNQWHEYIYTWKCWGLRLSLRRRWRESYPQIESFGSSSFFFAASPFWRFSISHFYRQLRIAMLWYDMIYEMTITTIFWCLMYDEPMVFMWSCFVLLFRCVLF